MFIQTKGKLRFGRTNIVVDIDDQIVQYYYSLIPKYFCPQRQAYRSHITVARSKYEQWPSSINWTGREVCFEYENIVSFDGTYFFLRVLSEDIGRIREGLGLTYNRWIFDCFHITIGNLKDSK